MVNNKFLNVLSIFISVSIPLMLADAFFKHTRLPSSGNDVMLLAGGSMQTNAHKANIYTPNSKMRTAIVYGKKLEYDYKFDTDQYGFRSTFDCSHDNPSNIVAIAGDSFTEAQGSSISWTSQIQRELCNNRVDSVNVGMPGLGIVGMKDSLFFAYDEIGARKAIVAIITADLRRGPFPVKAKPKCSTGYGKFTCTTNSSTWWHLPYSHTKKQLLSFAYSKQRYGLIPSLSTAQANFKTTLKSFLPFTKSRSLKNRRVIVQSAIDDFNSIVSKFEPNNVILTVLPTKEDRNIPVQWIPEDENVVNSELELLLDNINPKVSYVDLRSCPLDNTHFHEIDGHPNAKGQLLLGQCFADEINIDQLSDKT